MTSQNPQSSVKLSRFSNKDKSQRWIGVQAPFHPAANARWRALGGSWNESTRAWLFDPRDETRVRDACVVVYGTDGTPTTLVDVRLAVADIPGLVSHIASPSIGTDTVFALGRQLLRRFGRDGAVQLGDGVVITEGAFSAGGGSARYPAIGVVRGVVIEVRDVPAVLADQAIAAGWATEVPGSRREPQTQPAPVATAPTATSPDDALLAAARAALAALTPEQRMRLLTESLDADTSR